MGVTQAYGMGAQKHNNTQIPLCHRYGRQMM
jgi:hypothetical protein